MSWGQELNNFTGATASAQQQYKNTLKLQKQNQAWQTEMANTAHQREVADLENAGLNPIISANGGAPTGAPGGGSASTGSSQGNAIDMIGSLVNSLAIAKQTQNNTAKTNADIENETNKTNADVIKALADAGVSQKTIEHYIKYGTFPNATTTRNTATKVGPISIERSETTPIGYGQTNNSAKAFKNMSKEKWQSLSKAQKAVFPSHLQKLYNETYND